MSSEADRLRRAISAIGDDLCLTIDGRFDVIASVPDDDDDDEDVQKLVMLTNFLLQNVRDKVAEVSQAAEQAQAERRKAEQAARAATEFLANVSHEIRTPMNGVVGMTELLLETDLTPDQAELGRMIASSAETLLRIINDILDLTKIEAGGVTLEDEPYDLQRLLTEIVAEVTVRQHAGLRGLTPRFGSTVVVTQRGDRFRVRQILTNLIANAVKFASGAQIGVDVKRLFEPSRFALEGALDRSVPGGNWRIIAGADRPMTGRQWLRVKVWDEGPGMTQEQIARLTEKFHQADSSIARRFGGTGLGLAITSSLVDLLGGRLSVASAVGKGTVFFVDLPNRPETTLAVTTPVDAANPETGPLEILLVEDNEVNRLLAIRMLAGARHRITVAEDGEAAVAAAAYTRFDSILMDIQMPGLSGVDAMRLIRDGSGPSAGSRIIALTANAMLSDREAYLAAGADDYLAKPYRRSELLTKLGRSVQPTAKTEDRLFDEALWQDNFGRESKATQLEILTAVGTSLRNSLAVLEADFSASDVAGACHRLASTAGSVGYSLICGPAAQIEQAVRAGDTSPDLADRIAMLVRDVHRIASDLDARVEAAST